MADRETPIWEDADVRRIYSVIDGVPHPRFHEFNELPDQLALVVDFVIPDQQADSDDPPDAFTARCLAGIRAVERLPLDVDDGWKKLFIYRIDVNNHYLWDLHKRRAEVAAIAEWTVVTIEQHGWGPDGNTTPLGQRHSSAMALAASAGGGVRLNPRTNSFEYGNGDRARQAAAQGGFATVP
jgi:hypothetical protein